MKLVIAEKPSVAQDLARVLGACQRKDGYCEGKKYLVSWCYGHLAGLADAGTYDERYTKWKLEDLPILPSPFRFLIAPDKQEQFDILRALMNREDVTEVINACDAGREGELIFRSVYYLADCRKPMTRLWISSMEDSAIQEGFAHLSPGEDYDALYQSALCRAKADWLVGINASRFFSLTYKTKLNVGRVMSPTLALLVQRQSAISAFTPESYYTVDLGIGEFHAVSERFSTKAEAEALAAACKAESTAVVKEIRQQEKKEAAPALYDLTNLQREANRLLGYTAQQTLDYLQALYEKKLCTYPRTDSRYLTDDMLPRVKEILLWASGICGLPITDEVYGEQLCDSQKVTDHHAIIPTKAASWQDLTALPIGEQNILKLISRQVMIATSGPYCYKEADTIISCGGADFKLHLKMPQDFGWKRYTAEKKGGKWFPGLATGQALTPDTVTVKDGKTQPPKPFTDAEDVLLMGKKVFRDFYGRNLFQLVREVAGVPDVVRLLQSMGNNLLMLRVVFPEVGAAGALCTAGVSYIEHIPEPGSIPGLVNEGDPFCALSNVASHAFVPQVVFRACGSIWSLGVDHELFMVWVLVQAGGRGKKVCPTLEAGGYLGRHIVRQLVVVL